MFHSVIIATKGRPRVIKETIHNLMIQDSLADELIISATESADLEEMNLPEKTRILFVEPGLSTQINAAIRAIAPEATLVTILDDDVELAPDYFSILQKYMEQNPDVAGASGIVLLDGATRDEAESVIRRHIPNPSDTAQDVRSFYGCNMSFRRSALTNEFFDERMKLNSWMADFEFSSRIAKKGKLKLLSGLRLCHLKTASGRMNHERFGFAQIMHPWYFYKKGAIELNELWMDHLLTVLAANVLKFPAEPINRIKRLKGNLFALKLIAQGFVEPEAIVRIPST